VRLMKPMKQVSSALLILAVAAAAAAATTPSPSFFDQAQAASTSRGLAKARDLYRQAAESDPDPDRRDKAAIEAAILEWYVFHDTDAARSLFARVGDTSREASRSWSERASMEIELTRDFDAARIAAAKAMELAKTLTDRETAALRAARAIIEPARLARLDGKCPRDEQSLRSAIEILRKTISEGGPVLDSSRLLLDAALLAGDVTNQLQAWRWYYSDVPSVVPAAIGDRRALGLGLARAGLYGEAELVLRDPCASDKPDDDAVRDVLAYAAALRRIESLDHEHNRAVARAAEDNDAFQKAIGGESVALWNALSWQEKPPAFSLERFQGETYRRFGTVATLGNTENIFGLLLGHAVLDETRKVEQYGRTAPLRYVSLDGMVAGGYSTWATRGHTGTGGWTSDAIYEVRPMYADDPVTSWRRLTDPQLRAQYQEEIAAETRRDLDRAKEKGFRYYPGLAMRLKYQTSEITRAALVKQGLTGDKLRDSYLVRERQDVFDYSIWAHEGRHAIDKKIFKISEAAELEFRAKLSQVIFAPIPRGAFGAILRPIGGTGPHGIANERLLKLIVPWMKAHAKQITGFDATQPVIIQLDKLTDEQLRAAFRSFDPLAK
jgi:hypothetical protein